MNWEKLKYNWPYYKGELKRTWSRLTDDDLEAINGRREELARRLRERYGYEEVQAIREVTVFCRTR